MPAISVMGCPTKKVHTHRAQGEVLYCNLMHVQSVHKILMVSARPVNSLRQVSVYREREPFRHTYEIFPVIEEELYSLLGLINPKVMISD